MRRALFVAAFGLAFAARPSLARAGGTPCGTFAEDAGDDAGDDASDDAGTCSANEYCAYPDGGPILNGSVGSCAVQACGGGNGPCAVNVYCGLPDAGVILDGAAGVCTLEPCVLSSDCPNDEICDTSQNPFACVGCISGSDCQGVLVCDTTTHTCVNPPPVPEGGAEDASSEDAATDASTAGDAADGAAPPPPADASPIDATAEDAGEGDAGPVVAPPDQGSLGGGAWDCGLAITRETPFETLAIPLAVVALFVARRRSGGRKRR